METAGIRIAAIYDQNPQDKNAVIFAVYAYFTVEDSPNQALYCYTNDKSKTYDAKAIAALAQQGNKNVVVFGRDGGNASLTLPKPVTWFTLASDALPGRKAKLQVGSTTQQVVYGSTKSFFTVRFKYDPGPIAFQVQFEGNSNGLPSGLDGHVLRIADGARDVAARKLQIYGIGIQSYTSPFNTNSSNKGPPNKGLVADIGCGMT